MTGRDRSSCPALASSSFSGWLTAPGRCAQLYSPAGSTSTNWAPRPISSRSSSRPIPLGMIIPNPGVLMAGQARVVRQQSGLGAVLEAELVQHPGYVALDRALGEVEPGRDLGIGLSLAQAGEHLHLALGERADQLTGALGRRLAVGGGGDQPPGSRWREHRMPLGRYPHQPDQVFRGRGLD